MRHDSTEGIDRTMRRPPLWLVAGGGLLVAVALVALRPQGVSVVQAILGVGILAVGSTPMLVFLWGRHPAPIPVFPVAGLFYAVCFGLPVFLADVIWPPGGKVIHYHSVFVADRGEFLNVQALALVLAGITLSTMAYYLAAKAFSRRMPQLTLPKAPKGDRLILLLGLLLAGHVVYLFVPFLRHLPSIGQFLEPAGYLAFGGFYWLWRDGKISGHHAAVLFGLIMPAVIVKKLTGGLLSPVILVGLFFFFLMIFFRNRAALAVAGLCAVLVVGGYGPMTILRTNIWAPAFKTYSIPEKIEHAFDFRKPDGHLDDRVTKSAGMVMHRIAFLAMFSRVVELTPGTVPYWQGDTYKPLLTSSIPRALWSGKPEERAGRRFGLAYGFIVPASRMSMNMPWIVEMFVNFGPLGVLAGMTLVGLFMAFLDRAFNRPGMTPLEALVGLTIIFPLSYPESNFSEMTGSLLLLTLALWFYFRFGLTIFPGQEERLGPRRPS